MSIRPLPAATSLLLAVAVAACAGPSSPAPSTEPDQRATTLAALKRLVLSQRKEPLLRHVLDGQVYYLAMAPCCDALNDLFDAQGNPVCAPSGGLSGAGDGRCPPLRAALLRSQGERVANPFYKP